MVEVLLDDEQLVGDVAQIAQDDFELLYGRWLAQVGVDHQHAVRDGGRADRSQNLGRDVVFRPQDRADGWNLGRLISQEMNKH